MIVQDALIPYTCSMMTHLWILCVGQSVCSTPQAHIYNNNSGILMLLQTWHRSFFNSDLLPPAKLFPCQKTNEHRHQPPRQRISEPVSGAKMGSLNVTSEFIFVHWAAEYSAFCCPRIPRSPLGALDKHPTSTNWRHCAFKSFLRDEAADWSTPMAAF